MAEWLRHGDCIHCGHCCTMVARDVLVRTDDQVARDPAFYAARGFRRLETEVGPRHVLWAWLHAPCPQQTAQEIEGSVVSACGIHATRPQTCVDYPRLPQDIVGTPCSYWFERTDMAGHVVRAGGTGSPHPTDEHGLIAFEGSDA